MKESQEGHRELYLKEHQEGHQEEHQKEYQKLRSMQCAEGVSYDEKRTDGEGL